MLTYPQRINYEIPLDQVHVIWGIVYIKEVKCIPTNAKTASLILRSGVLLKIWPLQIMYAIVLLIRSFGAIPMLFLNGAPHFRILMILIKGKKKLSKI